MPAASAIEVRTYSAARHDRFTGFPENPAWNDAAYYGSRKFTGIGWIPGETNGRQFALVSPTHLLFALHYGVGAGTSIRFLNSAGAVVNRTSTGYQLVESAPGQNTDLYLLVLDAPLAQADGVSLFPYLNLASEAAYTGKELTVFGWSVRAGRATLNLIEDAEIAGNATRVMRFSSPKTGTNPDDAHMVIGDSGSPSFAIVGGNPAILGVHSANGESSSHYFGYDAFIPHYITALNTLMEPSGYRMTPATPPVVTLATALVTDTPLRQARPGTCRFDLTNTGATDGGNAKVSLHFPVGTGPASISASGWIAESTGPQDWSFRRANLVAGAIGSFTATWLDLPSQSTIAVEMTPSADGSASSTGTLTMNLLPSFAVWAENLADPSVTGDSDADGVINLLEYAFGGDPAVGSRSSAAGNILLPVISTQSGRAVLEFPVREDGVARGLGYVVEYSETLESESWSTPPPPGLLDQTAEFSPDIPGFVRRTVSWDAVSPKRFCRVRVTLDE